MDPVIEGLFDIGDKALVVGSSKAGKTWILIEMALRVACGKTPFFRWRIPRARSVLYVQLELRESWVHRRIKKVATSFGIAAAAASKLKILNLRGDSIEELMKNLTAAVQSFAIEVIIFDPLYKLLEGDENSGQDVKPLLHSFDVLAEAGVAVVYSHHNPKGRAGDREVIDRGAGSGVIQRDMDCGIFLTAHAEDDLLVVETEPRNYPRTEPFSIKFDTETQCHVVTDTAAVVRTAGNRRQKRDPNTLSAEEVLAMFPGSCLAKTEFQARLERVVTSRGARAHIQKLVQGGTLVEVQATGPRGKGYGTKFIGPPEFAEDKKRMLDNWDGESCTAPSNRQCPD